MSLFRTDITVDILNARSGENLPGYLGVELTDLREFELESRMTLRKIHFAPNTYLHAASVIALADTTCGYATVAHLPAGASSFTTIELKSNFLGTTRGQGIICKARAQHLGKNTQVWDAEVFDEETHKKIALFRCSQMILWPKQ
jgi:1,4-dihydroxy-2-naphthoyl-CoA hydrolase